MTNDCPDYVKAASEHLCHWCGRLIVVGERYKRFPWGNEHIRECTVTGGPVGAIPA